MRIDYVHKSAPLISSLFISDCHNIHHFFLVYYQCVNTFNNENPKPDTFFLARYLAFDFSNSSHKNVPLLISFSPVIALILTPPFARLSYIRFFNSSLNDACNSSRDNIRYNFTIIVRFFHFNFIYSSSFDNEVERSSK